MTPAKQKSPSRSRPPVVVTREDREHAARALIGHIDDWACSRAAAMKAIAREIEHPRKERRSRGR